MFFVIISFVIIALMRVIQNLCGKTASKTVSAGETFFRYGAYYQFIASLFALITLAIVGFYGFNAPTFICSLISAILFAIELFTNIEAMKGAPLTVCTMFALGGLIISCVCGIFMFDEPMSWLQAGGLLLFLVGAYFLVSKPKTSNTKITSRTYILLFINLLVNGLIMIVQKYFSVKVVGGNVSAFSFLTFLLNAIIMAICLLVCVLNNKNKKCVVEEKKENSKKDVLGLSKTLLVCGALLAFALFVINYLVTELGKTVDSVILFPVSSALTISITTLIGWLVFKEKLTIKNFIGLIVGLSGIIVIGVF